MKTNKANKALFKIFQLIQKSPLDDKKKKAIIRPLFVGEEWSWVVCGISKESLKEFKSNKFKKTPYTFQRHHFKPFKGTVEKLLSSESLTFDKWAKIIEDREKTHIITKDEHRAKEDYEYYEIPTDKGLFKNKNVGFSYTNKEKDFLQEINKADPKKQKFSEG